MIDSTREAAYNEIIFIYKKIEKLKDLSKEGIA